MDEAVFLAALENFIALGLVYLAAVARADVILRALVEEDADVLLQMPAALAHEAAAPSAGAVGDRDGPGVFNYLVYLLVGAAVGIVLNRHLDGDDAHHALADRHEGRERGNAPAGILLKALGYDRVALHLLLVADHHLHDARHPYRQEELVLPVLEAHAAQAYVRQLVEHLAHAREGLLDLLGHLGGGDVLAHLEAHGDFRHLVGYDRVEYLILGVVGSDARIGAALQAYLCRQLED